MRWHWSKTAGPSALQARVDFVTGPVAGWKPDPEGVDIGPSGVTIRSTTVRV